MLLAGTAAQGQLAGAWHSLAPTSAAVHIHVQPLLQKETEKLRRFLTGLLESGGPSDPS